MSKFFKKVATATVVGLTLLAGGTANAGTMLGQEPDASLIVRKGSYEWVYASPCAAVNGCGTVERHHGFDFATTEQWNTSFANIDALVAAFTVNGELRCAAKYFSTSYDHCDLTDLESGRVWNSPFSDGIEEYYAETFLVRTVETSDVPEPASLALLGLGLAGVAAGRRKRK